MPRGVVMSEGIEDVQFFGDVDRNKHGEIGSEMPAWAMDKPLGDLKEEARQLEGQLERHEIPEIHRPGKLDRLKKVKQKIDDVEKSRPKLSGQQKDVIAKIVGSSDHDRGSIGDKIRESMFTRSEMGYGVSAGIRPEDELRRQGAPCIQLSPEEKTIAKAMGLERHIDKHGKVSRNVAQKIYSIGRHSLGETADPELLRSAR